jgi:hypothetical protein
MRGHVMRKEEIRVRVRVRVRVKCVKCVCVGVCDVCGHWHARAVLFNGSFGREHPHFDGK